MQTRKQFQLPVQDVQFLDSYGCHWEAINDGSQWVLILDFPTIHPGYNYATVTTAIRIETAYPKAQLDMVYFYPELLRKDGKPLKATQAKQKIDGKEFQRWSRHYSKRHPFVPGEDGLERHVLTIEDWLIREFDG